MNCWRHINMLCLIVKIIGSILPMTNTPVVIFMNIEKYMATNLLIYSYMKHKIIDSNYLQQVFLKARLI